VEGVELDAGVEVLLEALNDARADEGLSAVQEECDDRGKRDEDEQSRQYDPFEPPTAAQERFGCIRQKREPPALELFSQSRMWDTIPLDAE
jgi:hypothetical protein